MEQDYTKRQRSIEKNRGIGPWLLAMAVLVLILAVTGCTLMVSKEERLANACYLNGGKAQVKYSETAGAVECR